MIDIIIAALIILLALIIFVKNVLKKSKGGCDCCSQCSANCKVKNIKPKNN
ncbi:MAG: FeoB-associated Cys-rich membrane protein [Clostridium sp.]|nr:FeoB-associated Cys-rich membrane protein [Clostridium sp.]